MSDKHKSILFIIVGILLGSTYLYSLWWFGASLGKGIQVVFEIVFFFVGIAFWKFFFAQFILPVSTFEERKKIYQLLNKGAGGPAIFIENGKAVAGVGEKEKEGEGVILVDTASAVVLKKTTNFTRTAGPGVVFTEKGEHIAEEVGLHKQSDSLGPRAEENPFISEEDAKNAEEYKSIQERRFETSALTRDGIEVVPNIDINFKIDADPAKDDEIGSRFGYDEEAVRKAVWHAGINPDISASSRRHDVGWNQLPIYIVADLWREYLSKYKFKELFQNTQEIIDNDEACPEKELLEDSSASATIKPAVPSTGIGVSWYKFLGDLYQDWADSLNKIFIPKPVQQVGVIENEDKEEEENSAKETSSPEKITALEVIVRMINQRMKEPCYEKVDAYGKVMKEKEVSREYDFLRNERGIRVLNVSVHTLRFDKGVDEKLQEDWGANWHKFAKKEAGLIKKEEEIRKLRGKEKAHFEYAFALSRDVVNGKMKNKGEILDLLLRSTRKEMVRNNQLLALNEKRKEEDNIDRIDDIEDLRQRVSKGGGF